MEKLWSPWRSKYISSFKDKKEDDNSCVFCGTQYKEVEDNTNQIVHKGKEVFVMLNLYPYNNGHLMMIPYRHVSDYTELTKTELAEIMELNSICIKALNTIMEPQGYNFGANIGRAAGAGIDTHLHFHLVPRWNGDTNFMPALGEVKIISEDLQTTKNNLIAEFKKLNI
ncbi:MAG: HIT domain-containing protein [Melioribacteraceae bacterium]